MKKLPMIIPLVILLCFTYSCKKPPTRGIIFVSDRGEGEEIYIIDPDGKNEQRLTHSGEGKGSHIPEWSPDGKKIAFASNRNSGGKHSIYVMNPDGTDVERVGAGMGPMWQPDGERIAYVDLIASQKDGKLRVFMMNIDGTNIEPFTSRFFGGARSPDGKQIVFQTVPGKDVLDLGYPLSEELMSELEIYVANIDGTNERRLTDNDYYDGHCHW